MRSNLHRRFLMNKKDYSSAIKKTPFEYLRSRQLASMIKEDMLYNELFERCVVKGELPIVSDQRRKEVFNVVYDRLVSLDSFLLNEFLNGGISTSKFILAYAIADTDPLFMEFLLVQYREALFGKKYISISDFDDFFALEKEKIPVVASWGKATLTQLAGGYRNILVESGLGKRIKKNIYVDKPIINPAVVKHIDSKGGKPFLQAVLGVK